MTRVLFLILSGVGDVSSTELGRWGIHIDRKAYNYIIPCILHITSSHMLYVVVKSGLTSPFVSLKYEVSAVQPRFSLNNLTPLDLEMIGALHWKAEAEPQKPFSSVFNKLQCSSSLHFTISTSYTRWQRLHLVSMRKPPPNVKIPGAATVPSIHASNVADAK